MRNHMQLDHLAAQLQARRYLFDVVLDQRPIYHRPSSVHAMTVTHSIISVEQRLGLVEASPTIGQDQSAGQARPSRRLRGLAGSTTSGAYRHRCAVAQRSAQTCRHLGDQEVLAGVASTGRVRRSRLLGLACHPSDWHRQEVVRPSDAEGAWLQDLPRLRERRVGRQESAARVNSRLSDGRIRPPLAM